MFLLATAIGTAGIALWQGGSWRELHLIADGILIFYVAMLFESKRRRDERTTKVRNLQDQRPEDLRILDHVEAGGQRF